MEGFVLLHKLLVSKFCSKQKYEKMWEIGMEDKKIIDG